MKPVKNAISQVLSPSFVCSINAIGQRCCGKRSFAGDDRVASKTSEMSRILTDMNLIDAPAWKFLLPESSLKV